MRYQTILGFYISLRQTFSKSILYAVIANYNKGAAVQI